MTKPEPALEFWALLHGKWSGPYTIVLDTWTDVYFRRPTDKGRRRIARSEWWNRQKAGTLTTTRPVIQEAQ